MGELLRLVTPLHERTARDYLARMNDEKVHCMGVAKQYGYDYWDGHRRYGYGGYRYDGRWKPVAERLIAHYKLSAHARILDVGCGKGHLLHELKMLLPLADVTGIDISGYGLSNTPVPIRPFLHYGRAQDRYPQNSFDLVMALGTLHNLTIDNLAMALREMTRVGRQQYVMVESYRNDQEQFNLQCWALTCQAFFNDREWLWLFQHFGYTGDYEFIYFT